MKMDELKPCPLLVQSDTNPSSVQNWMRPYFLECFGDRYVLCAAYRAGYGCPFVYDNRVDSKEEVAGMDEYINREELINNRPEGRNPKQIGKEEYNRGWNDCRSAFYALIEDMPAANVVPMRYGRWRYYHKQNIAVCEKCSFERNLDVNFGRAVSCPNCGAQMEDDRND